MSGSEQSEDSRRRYSEAIGPHEKDDLVEFICSAGKKLEIAAGEKIERSGDEQSIYLLESGAIMRSQIFVDGKEGTTATYFPGDILNLDLLVEPPRDDMLVTISDSTVRRLAVDKLCSELMDRPELSFLAMRRLVADADWLREALAAVGQLATRDRLVVFLAQSRRRMIAHGTLDPKSHEIPLPFTQTHLGRIIGATPVHVNRTISELRQEGIVEITRRAAYIADIEAFEARAMELSP